MRGTKIHLWLLTTGELACDLKSVISEAVSWKSSRNHNISYFNRTNNFLPLIYLYVWLTLLDWIQFAIDDLISGHICFHSYHCCVYVWKVTSIQNFKLVVSGKGQQKSRLFLGKSPKQRTPPTHTCKKRVRLRRRLFWPKKICRKSA